jgi:hypothetical protein
MSTKKFVVIILREFYLQRDQINGRENKRSNNKPTPLSRYQLAFTINSGFVKGTVTMATVDE